SFGKAFGEMASLSGSTNFQPGATARYPRRSATSFSIGVSAASLGCASRTVRVSVSRSRTTFQPLRAQNAWTAGHSASTAARVTSAGTSSDAAADIDEFQLVAVADAGRNERLVAVEHSVLGILKRRRPGLVAERLRRLDCSVADLHGLRPGEGLGVHVA